MFGQSARPTRWQNYPNSKSRFLVETLREDEYRAASSFVGGLVDYAMHCPAPLVEQRTCVTGFHGDIMWARSPKAISRDLVRGDSSGASLFEWRVATGFMHVPIPMIAFHQHPEIVHFSNSVEMVPWQIGGGYDRPVPRRVGEEIGGLPRNAFGLRKNAIALMVDDREATNEVLFNLAMTDYQTALAQSDNLWEQIT